jgi:hypothetical protein
MPLWTPQLANPWSIVISCIRDKSTKKKWTHSFANKLGRLAQQGVAEPHKGTGTIFFIPHADVPKDRKATYGCIVVAIRPQKKEVERTRLTMGRNLINYPSKVSTRTAGLTTTKILFNNVLSTEARRQIHGHRPKKLLSQHSNGPI